MGILEDSVEEVASAGTLKLRGHVKVRRWRDDSDKQSSLLSCNTGYCPVTHVRKASVVQTHLC